MNETKTKREILAANRARSYNWRTDPRYIMSEMNPDPKMRPSFDKLMYKMKNLSILQNRPEAVSMLVGDLAYWFLYREAKRPDHLWKLMVRLQQLWSMATGTRTDMNIQMLEAAGQPVPVEVGHQLYYRILNDHYWRSCACGLNFATKELFDTHIRDVVGIASPSSGEPAATTSFEDLTPASTADEPSSGSPIQPEEAAGTGDSGADLAVVNVGDSPQEILKSALDKNKQGLKNLIWDHYPASITSRGTKCSCGRSYAHEEAWADHVRIRLKRFLLNEFPPIGVDNAE